jgi:hypothetical protein
MAVIRTVNPWSKSGGMEPQRSDLWILNLEKVLAAVSAIPQFENLSLPEPKTTRYYARQVIFPEVQVAEFQSKRHSIPTSFPGYDEPISGVRVDFMVDAWTMTSNPAQAVQSQMNSRIYNLLRCWHQMARVGRQMRTSIDDNFQIPLEEVPRSYANFFKFDVVVQLMSGVFSNPFDADNVGASTTSSTELLSTTDGFEVTTRVIMKRCWVSALQLGTLDQAQNGWFTVTATLIPEAITPYDGVNLGTLSVVS